MVEMSDDFEVVFLTAEWCPYCKQLKENWKPLFEQNIVKNIDIDTDEGKMIASKLGLKYIPACVVKEHDEYKVCEGDNIHEEV